jgi:hypothetical protein
MANELSRKGIAFGAAVALGSTLMVGGAAFGAPNAAYQDLELSPADSSNGVLATTTDDYFGMVLSWNGDVNTQNLDDLSYKITLTDDDPTEDEDNDGYGYFSSTAASYDTYEDQVVAYFDGEDFDGDMVYDAPHAGGSFTDTEEDGGIGYTGPVSAWDATSSFGRDEDGELSTYEGAPYIEIGVYETPDYKAEYTVQAFIDTNRNGVIDNTETHSAAVMVTFYNAENLTPVLALEDDGVVYSTEDSGSIDFDVTFAELLNDYYTADDDTNSTFDEDYRVISEVDTESYDSEDLAFGWGEDASVDEDGILGDSGSIDWDNYDEVEDNGSKTRVAVYNDVLEDFVTDFQYITVMEPEVDYTDNYVVEQDTVVRSGDGEDAIIHSDVESVEYVVEFWNTDEAEDAPVAGVDATVYVWSEVFETDEDAAAWLEDYGIEISDTEVELVELEDAGDIDYQYDWAVEGTSDAEGAITLDITVANPDSSLYLEVYAVDYEGTGAELDGDLEWDDASYYVDFQGSFGDEDNATAAVGGAFEFEAYVTDTWGQAVDGTVRVYSEDRGGWDEKNFDLDGGVVELNITDGEDSGEEYNSAYYSLDLIVDGDNLEFSGDEDFYVDWLIEDAKAGYVTADWDGSGIAAVNYYDDVTGNYELDYRALDEADFWDAYNGADGEFLEGYVSAPSGYKQGAQHVTVSGAGLYFLDYNSDAAKAGVGSVDLITDEGGYFYVWVQGKKVGEHTVTITSNGKSTTVDLVIDDSALYGSAVSVAPFTGKAGTAETVSATVTDKFGNKVPEADVSWSVVGGGYFSANTSSTDGEADDAIEDIDDAGYGVATTQLIIMSGEVGYGSTVTATIDVVDPLGVEEDTTASGSLAAGATDSGKPAFWTKDIGNGEVKLYAKNIVGAGKIQFFHNGNEVAWIKAVDALDPKLRAASGSFYLVRTLKLVSGKNVFEITDDGVRVVRRVASN